MRAYKWLGALALGLGLAGTASAQLPTTRLPTSNAGMLSWPSMSSWFSSSPPIAQPMYQPNRGGFHLPDYFPSFSGITNSPGYGQSTFPTEDQLPGLAYLQAFGFRRPKPAR